MADNQPITSDQGELTSPSFDKEQERKSRMAAWYKAYYASPEYKAKNTAWRKTYYATPEGKAKRAARDKAWLATPEGKAKRAAYRATPRVRAKKAARDKARRADPGARAKSAAQSRKRKYGISPAQYDAMLAECKGRCPICHMPFSELVHQFKPVIDHCHRTGVVRGVLCHGCNRSLNELLDQPNLLRAAARYLERSRRAFVHKMADKRILVGTMDLEPQGARP